MPVLRFRMPDDDVTWTDVVRGEITFAAGQVSLTDDDSGSALFTATALKPGLTATRCIKVTYTGNVASGVKVYATGYTGTLGAYLDLTIELGAGGTYADCTGFSPGSTIYSGTLAAFAAARTSYATGIAGFAPSSNPTAATYRFTYLLQDNYSAQNLTSACTFTWEAQSPG